MNVATAKVNGHEPPPSEEVETKLQEEKIEVIKEQRFKGEAAIHDETA